MEDIRLEIEAAIAKNMPGMVGAELKKLLERGARAVEELAILQASFDKQNKRFIEMTGERDAYAAKYNAVMVRESNIDAREKAVTARETKIEVMDAKIAAAEYGRDSVFKLTEIAFRNPRMLVTENESESYGFLGSYPSFAPRPPKITTIESAK